MVRINGRHIMWIEDIIPNTDQLRIKGQNIRNARLLGNAIENVASYGGNSVTYSKALDRDQMAGFILSNRDSIEDLGYEVTVESSDIDNAVTVTVSWV